MGLFSNACGTWEMFSCIAFVSCKQYNELEAVDGRFTCFGKVVPVHTLVEVSVEVYIEVEDVVLGVLGKRGVCAELPAILVVWRPCFGLKSGRYHHLQWCLWYIKHQYLHHCCYKWRYRSVWLALMLFMPVVLSPILSLSGTHCMCWMNTLAVNSAVVSASLVKLEPHLHKRDVVVVVSVRALAVVFIFTRGIYQWLNGAGQEDNEGRRGVVVFVIGVDEAGMQRNEQREG